MARLQALLPGAGGHGLTVRLLVLTLHPFTRYESAHRVRDEPPHQATLPRFRSPCGLRHPAREDASTQLLQPTKRYEHPLDRSTPESPPPSTFALGGGFHNRLPGRNLALDVTSGRASLDGEPLALAWPSMSLAFARNQRLSDLLALDREPSELRSLSLAYSANETVGYQPLTLCFHALHRRAPGLSHPSPRQRTTCSPDQSA